MKSLMFSQTGIFVPIIFFGFVLLIPAVALGLSDQEAYYWLWSKALALCYFEHPPLQAWSTRLFSEIFGDSAWVIRIPAFVGRMLGLLLIWAWADSRRGRVSASFSVWILATSFFVMATGVIALPDAWLFSLLAALLFFSERRAFVMMGILLGMAALAKWTAAFMVPGVVFALWAQEKSAPRRIAEIVLCGIIALLIQIPVLYWNAIHDWAAFEFHLRVRHAHISELSFMKILENATAFAGSQGLLGLFGFVVAAIAVLFTRRVDRARASGELMPLWPWVLPAFLVVGISALRGELRFYWTAPALIPIAVFMGERLALRQRLTQARIQKTLLLFGVLGHLLLVLAIMFPVGAWLKPYTDRYKHYDLRHSPRGDLDGWKEFFETKVLVDERWSDSVAVMATDFRLAGQGAWAFGIKDVTRVGTVYPIQNQFMFWARPHPDRFPRALFIGDNRYGAVGSFGGFCGHSLLWEQVEIKRWGHVVKIIKYAWCDQYQWDARATAEWLK